MLRTGWKRRDSMGTAPTIHNAARKEEVAGTVLMPGDPMRAKFVAETFLEDAKMVNSVRGMFGFTGTYQGKKVTVQGSGMGMPSMALYSHELFNFYDVRSIIRIGSTGGLSSNLTLNTIVIPIGASTDSNFQRQFNLPGVFSPTASFSLLYQAVINAKRMNIPVTVGNILTSDAFYFDDEQDLFKWCKMGIIAVDMETAALYTNAARAGKNALSLLTVSDNLVMHEQMPTEEREQSLVNMIQLALSLIE